MVDLFTYEDSKSSGADLSAGILHERRSRTGPLVVAPTFDARHVLTRPYDLRSGYEWDGS